MKLGKASLYMSGESKPREQPILPLVDDEEGKEIDDARSTTFKLRTIPTDADSAKYSFKVSIVDGTATPRQVIKWQMAMSKVFTGLNLTDAADRDRLIREMLAGAAKSAYTTGVTGNRGLRHERLRQAAVDAEAPRNEAGGETEEAHQNRINAAWNGVPLPDIDASDVKYGTQSVVNAQCPYKALEKQKRFMRHAHTHVCQLPHPYQRCGDPSHASSQRRCSEALCR